MSAGEYEDIGQFDEYYISFKRPSNVTNDIYPVRVRGISFESIRDFFLIGERNGPKLSLFIYYDFLDEDRDGYLDYLGLADQSGLSEYDLLSIVNMVPLTGWDSDKASEYIKDNDKITYDGIIRHVLGKRDVSVEKFEENIDLDDVYERFEWLKSLDVETILYLYASLVIFGSPNRQYNYTYRPGHILYQLLFLIKEEDPLVKFILTYLDGSDDPIYDQIGGFDEKLRDINIIKLAVVYKDYIESLYSTIRPSIDTPYKVLIICYNQRRTDLRNTAIGVNSSTKKFIKSRGFALKDVTFDAISTTIVKIDNQTFTIKNRFPDESVFMLFDDQQDKYDFVIFEYCPHVSRLINEDTIGFLEHVTKPGGIIVVTGTNDKLFTNETRQLLANEFDVMPTNIPRMMLYSGEVGYGYYIKR
jgi:hypothetical protein